MKDPDVRVTALEAIRIGSIDGDCTRLLPSLKSKDVELRLRAVEALGSLNNRTLKCNEELQLQLNDSDERIQSAAVLEGVDFHAMKVDEPSLLLRYTIALYRRELGTLKNMGVVYTEGIMTSWTIGSFDEQAWIQGVIQKQDDLCHEIFSWNDPNDKPFSHRGIRPPQFRSYGHPNRG